MRSKRKRRVVRAIVTVPVLLLMTVIALTVASCGGESESSSSSTGTTKYPPGTTSESVGQNSTASTSTTTTSTTKTSSTKSASSSSKQVGVTLELVNFTVTGVSRDDSNSAVVSGNSRELTGDFLQIDLTINNASGELADLSRYSYRLYSPAIDASSYEDYYGTTTTYGGYVKSHTISASLLDSSTLQQVSYTLRDGETAEDIFLFYDLNPLTIDTNADFSLSGATLTIYDTETAESVVIDLAAFAG